MNYTLEHELPGRMRLRNIEYSFTLPEARVVEALIAMQDGVASVSVSHRTGSMLIFYIEAASGTQVRDTLLTAVSLLNREFYAEIDGTPLVRHDVPTLCQAVFELLSGVLWRSLLPAFVRGIVTAVRALPLLGQGAKSMWRRGFSSVSVLDAAAVGLSLVRRDFRTASIITTLLALGELLENWTHKKSKESLTESLALHIDKLWVRHDGVEIQIPLSQLQLGDVVIVRAGGVIPVDGVIVEGEGMVNQSLMTGEASSVHRQPELSVYAGTVLEEGSLAIRVTALDNETRIHKIAQMIDASEALKADIQSRAERMADAIVPYNFALAGLIYLFTRDAMRASAALLVDYSCAIKLATPLAILSAMREGATRGMLIKGGKFLEALAAADTVVFDKTGTLTQATPKIVAVVPFAEFSREQVLRMAACLEEHFPHSVARAVVAQAEEENLKHREEHSEPEYVIAHGIAARLFGERVLIGSAHFVLEDEGIPCTAAQREVVRRAEEHCSVLYLAYGGRLAGLICIEDPLRADARSVVSGLRQKGFRRIVMLTGDGERTAHSIASQLGIVETRADLLPADKTTIVTAMKEAGCKVVMVGDGVNDSPALSASDVGIAMKSGADIAQEVADIVLTDNRLTGILDARALGAGTMRKINRNFAFIIGANSALLGLGLLGWITPAASALLHNLATLGASTYSMLPVLSPPSGDEEQNEDTQGGTPL